MSGCGQMLVVTGNTIGVRSPVSDRPSRRAGAATLAAVRTFEVTATDGAARAGVQETRRLYELAIAERYRFYSFGDAMLIL